MAVLARGVLRGRDIGKTNASTLDDLLVRLLSVQLDEVDVLRGSER
jgi:hypothetical protein